MSWNLAILLLRNVPTTHSIIFIPGFDWLVTSARFYRCAYIRTISKRVLAIGASLHVRVDDDRTLAVTRVQIAKDTRNHAHIHIYICTYVYRGGEVIAGVHPRAYGRHNKRKPEVAADRFWPRSVVDLEKAAARRDAAAARHGTRHETRPDCVATTCELPTDAGVETPTYYPSTDSLSRRSPARGCFSQRRVGQWRPALWYRR